MPIERKVGMSLKLPYLCESFFREMVSSGVSAAEISPASGDYDLLDFGKIRKDADAAGLTLWSFHYQFSPFGELNIASLDRDLRAGSVARLSEQTKKAADIGITRFVIHASGEPIADGEREESLKAACESLDTLASLARSLGAVIAVEDLPRTCLGNCHSDILRLIREDPALGVCFDSNHLLLERGEDFLAAAGKRLITVHISDFDFINERHWLPGEGKIDWKSMMDALDAAEYRGVLLYELGFGSTGTINRPRELVPADFAQNARELFARTRLTTHGTPYENLGMWCVNP